MFATLPRLRITFASLALAFSLANPLWGYTKSGSVYTTDGSQSDVSAAIANASAGDTVLIPAGTFTWGANKTFVTVNKAITLAGAGPDRTTILLAADAGTHTSATIRISAAAVVRGFAAQTPGGSATSVISATTANGWRVTNVVYNATPPSPYGYFVYASSYGLIDNCTINNGGGTNEPIFMRGPSDSWQTPSSKGTANAIFIEDCTFTGPGYVCDGNSNARFVVRFCTIAGNQKVDAHGAASNSPPRSARHYEIYRNQWTAAAGSWNAMELRGGTGMVFDNVCENFQSPNNPRLRITEYGVAGTTLGAFGGVPQTPLDYPILDQIGVGMDPRAGGSEPMYLWNNRRAGILWSLSLPAPTAAAIDRYRELTGNPLATFTMDDIIAADRDYFIESVIFTGTGGVGRGVKAQMLAIRPIKAGVGFWVTDEGEWNSEQAGPDGQLYVWSGSAWALNYTPYAYPHPLRGGPATPPSEATVKILVTPKQ